jgi:hypothetical protein
MQRNTATANTNATDQELEDSAEVTGTPDEHYNLVSVLYHSLKGAETYATYVEDADEAGDEELAEFFQDVQEQEQARADRAKELLVRRLMPAGDGNG